MGLSLSRTRTSYVVGMCMFVLGRVAEDVRNVGE